MRTGAPRVSVGTRIGRYEIRELIGSGGMGEVYRARDTQLGRDVAIKLLPEAFTGDAERLARFEREARVLAALNHPHIAAIYGIESSDRGEALVLELVEGEALSERLGTRPLPVRDALRAGLQIADALDAAHAKGIIHRDLKPANIRLTPGGAVKVLDFGLAKVEDELDVAAPGDMSESPTVALEATRAGVILGTAPYMSPEQARGRPADKRSDVWAFGCVLFEMLTGRRAFAAATVPDTFAAILEREPDWSTLPNGVPRSISRLLRRCLEKDPARRLRDMGHARAEIEHALAPQAAVTRTAAWAGAVLVLAAVLVGLLWFRSAPTAPADRSRWVQLTNFDYATQPALSPDGRMVAFIRGPGTFTTNGQIHVKPLPDGEAVQLTSDDLPKMSPVFSPDGSTIAYTTREAGFGWNTRIVRVLRGEPSPWHVNASGLTWVRPGQILFSEIKSGIHMAIVTATESRAEARDIYVPSSAGGMAHRSRISPDGRSVLIVEMDERGVWLPCRVVPFDGGGAGRAVGPGGSACTDVAWSPDGSWMYLNVDAGDGFHIWRQRFPDGPPEQLTFGPTQEEGIAIAPDGRSVIASVGLRQRSVWIHDESGDRQVSTEGYAYWPLLSTSGRHLVYRISSGSDAVYAPSQLWVSDVATGRSVALLPELRVIGYQISGSDRVVASALGPDGRTQLWLGWLDGRQAPQRIPGAEGDLPVFGPDGAIVFRGADAGSTALFSIREDGTGRTKIAGSADVSGAPGVSPDGEWVAAGVTDSRGERRLLAFSTRGAPPVVLKRGHGRLRWSGDRRHLYISIPAGDVESFAVGRTYVLPLRDGTMLPDIPEGGFESDGQLAALPGVSIIPYGDVAPGPRPGVYAFSRVNVTRNLYRIPLR